MHGYAMDSRTIGRPAPARGADVGPTAPRTGAVGPLSSRRDVAASRPKNKVVSVHNSECLFIEVKPLSIELAHGAPTHSRNRYKNKS